MCLATTLLGFARPARMDDREAMPCHATKSAHTDFKLLGIFPARPAGVAHIEARPKTGRTHQIRVHLSESGLPILGDPHYGYDSRRSPIEVPRMLLHAVSLTFPHPIHQNETYILCPLPEDFLQCVAGLGGSSENSKE